MLYTPSHAELGQHPKTRRLARLLGVSIPTAIGHLHLLWHFALKYAPDGDLAGFDALDVADGALWEGEPTALLSALADAGWLDAGQLHDWGEYGGKFVKRKEDNAERMRDARATGKYPTNPPRAAHVQRTSETRATLEETREEKTREEEKRVDGGGLHPAPKPKDRVPAPTPPSADQLVDELADWADRKGVRDILRDEVERFIDHCLAGKDGRQVVYQSYTAAARKWITNPNFAHGPRAPNRNGPDAKFARTVENLRLLGERR
jgi:hypothetical protein